MGGNTRCGTLWYFAAGHSSGEKCCRSGSEQNATAPEKCAGGRRAHRPKVPSITSPSQGRGRATPPAVNSLVNRANTSAVTSSIFDIAGKTYELINDPVAQLPFYASFVTGGGVGETTGSTLARAGIRICRSSMMVGRDCFDLEYHWRRRMGFSRRVGSG
jgi:hypothetical protein